jgi:adenosine deaminase
VIEAALHGMTMASEEVPITWGLIVTALRHLDDSDLAAEAAARFSDDGVVGFDLAGPERGNPPDRHLSAIGIARRAGLGITVHAGEGDGPHSMWRARALCGAHRFAHGARIVEDTDFDGSTIGVVGSFASEVRDHRIPLELAVSSNVGTGLFPDPTAHPLGALYRAGFNVSINTDNRLMSATDASTEHQLAVDAFGLTARDLGEITIRAIEAGFGDWTTRRRIIDEVVAPAYAPTEKSFDSIQSRTSPRT